VNHRNFVSLQCHLVAGVFIATLLSGCVDKEGYRKLADEAESGGAGNGSAGCEGDACPDGTPTCNDDGTCDEDDGESTVSCPTDCPAEGDACGDGTCDPGENALSCPLDCTVAVTCGDGVCSGDEDATSCDEDCPAVCGDDVCTGDEDVESCEEDCPAVCGDGVCTPGAGEDTANCAMDCCGHAFGGDVEGWYRVRPDPMGNQASDVYIGQMGDISGGGGQELVETVFRDGVSRFLGGTFDLGTGNNARQDDCEQCVRVLEDIDPNDQMPARAYFQTAGTLDVTSKPFLGDSVLTLRNAVFHVLEGGDVNPAGECFYIDELVIDTEPSCGDGVCSVGEVCPDDCPCGNGSCDVGDEDNCPGDCVLQTTQGNFRCDGEENKQNTPQDCCEVSLRFEPGDEPLDMMSLVDPGDIDGFYGYGTALPNLIGGPDEEWLELQFFDADVGGMTVDLSAGNNVNFATCNQCVMLLQDRDDPLQDQNWAAEYFQREGSLVVSQAPTPNSNAMMVRLQSVVMEEVTIDWEGSFESTYIPGGRCMYLDGVEMRADP